ncbi:MAG: hypothetical protein HQ501_08250 [Rhodospirillales bacterium]|nr:hypothetical protein [Rhodospirillales bacterium]
MAETSPPTDSDANEDRQPDISALARQYVDLWQQQLSGAASDEALAGVMAQTVQLMNAGATAMASYATSQALQASPAKNDYRGNDGGNNDVGDTGTTPVAASSGVDDSVVDELHRRIEQLEKRIAALETGTGGKGS